MKFSPIICTPSGYGITAKMSVSWQLVLFGMNSESDVRRVTLFLFDCRSVGWSLKWSINGFTETMCKGIDSGADTLG